MFIPVVSVPYHGVQDGIHGIVIGCGLRGGPIPKHAREWGIEAL